MYRRRAHRRLTSVWRVRAWLAGWQAGWLARTVCVCDVARGGARRGATPTARGAHTMSPPCAWGGGRGRCTYRRLSGSCTRGVGVVTRTHTHTRVEGRARPATRCRPRRMQDAEAVAASSGAVGRQGRRRPSYSPGAGAGHAAPLTGGVLCPVIASRQCTHLSQTLRNALKITRAAIGWHHRTLPPTSLR